MKNTQLVVNLDEESNGNIAVHGNQISDGKDLGSCGFHCSIEEGLTLGIPGAARTRRPSRRKRKVGPETSSRNHPETIGTNRDKSVTWYAR